MTAGNPRGSVRKLRELALSLNISGDTKEQTLLLAIIDALDEFAEVIGDSGEAPVLLGGETEIGMFLKCPNCGEPINLNFSEPQSGEPVVCASCHEIIGVITASM